MDPAKFAKILSMADSEHHGEALSALRAARFMLEREGMSFRDLANAFRIGPRLEGPREESSELELDVESAREAAEAAMASRDAMAAHVEFLQKNLNELEHQVRLLKRLADRHKRAEVKQREEAERWKALARETAEKLWDLGKALERRHSWIGTAGKRQAIIECLSDPARAAWSDREIARRVGTASQEVARLRRRVAESMGRRPAQTRGRNAK